ncbi:RNA-binding domain-containing protein [Sphingobacterium gobiense]|uniref:Transcriptional regulator n=1 Tax=Sphingobacterium gobiense TaxID=1382456 RepID=A0A2S9JUU1_9SPHI|nr:RNA-binding domain-containing protein [Sphingobacterium gobiense]PRD57045.1 transcriptional regulator [Sphingobacterium gobiense]
MNPQSKLEELLKLEVENEIVEFKEAKTQFDKDKLGKYFSALTNEANLKGRDSAWLILGVKDTRKIVGTKITDKQLNEYKQEISKHTSPKCNFLQDHRISTSNGEVILLELPAASKGYPVSWKGHWYGRDGESLVALHDFEYERIKRQLDTEDWSADIVSSATLDDLSPEAIAFARIQFKEKHPRLKDEIDRWSDSVFLDKAKLTIKGKITNTAILLLGKSESEHLISPAVARITWILKDRDNVEKDYEHFYCPFVTAVEKVSAKIRNLKYRYIAGNTLFPEEVDQYDPYIIREALNNCIAHQDYTMGGKIVVVESEDGWLSFTNVGKFIPNSVEEVVIQDSPEPTYRNSFLVTAMVNLNMIDTIGSGIKKMFNIQRHKFFPLPDYDLSDERVKAVFFGKLIDVNYAKKLAELPELSLEEIMLLDKVAKQKSLSSEAIQILRSKRLIEGRRPNYHISSDIAKATNQEDDYIKLRGIENAYIQKIIIDYLSKFGGTLRKDLEVLLMPKLSEGLSDIQKRDKIKNQLQELKRKKVIYVEGKEWRLVKSQ